MSMFILHQDNAIIFDVNADLLLPFCDKMGRFILPKKFTATMEAAAHRNQEISIWSRQYP